MNFSDLTTTVNTVRDLAGATEWIGRGLDVLPASAKGRAITTYFKTTGKARDSAKLEQIYQANRNAIDAYWNEVIMGSIMEEAGTKESFLAHVLPPFIAGAVVGAVATALYNKLS